MEDVGGKRRRLAIAAWMLPLAWASLLLVISSRPADSLPPGGFWGADKLVHASIYAVLGALSARAHSRAPLATWPTAAVVITLLLVGFGLLDEWSQEFAPGRQPSAGDAVADAVGSVAGFLAVSRYYRRRNGAHPQLRR